jgi:hypothetical protein
MWILSLLMPHSGGTIIFPDLACYCIHIEMTNRVNAAQWRFIKTSLLVRRRRQLSLEINLTHHFSGP